MSALLINARPPCLNMLNRPLFDIFFFLIGEVRMHNFEAYLAQSSGYSTLNTLTARTLLVPNLRAPLMKHSSYGTPQII
jgi:lysozyme family protein